MSNKEVYIVSAVRTPLGSFGGMFANVSATELGTAAIKGALEKGKVDPKNLSCSLPKALCWVKRIF